jgi:hypothetical protein
MDFKNVLRVAAETETIKENFQNRLELDEGDPGFQLLTEEEIDAVFCYLFIFICTTYTFQFSIYFFCKFFKPIFCLLNSGDLFPKLIWVSIGLLYLFFTENSQDS